MITEGTVEVMRMVLTRETFVFSAPEFQGSPRGRVPARDEFRRGGSVSDDRARAITVTED